MKSFSTKSITLLRRVLRWTAIKNLCMQEQLWQELSEYRKKSSSTGCSYSDYWELYKTIRIQKPKEILECGTGFSTLIMAYALMQNEKEGHPGKITSMEELELYYRMAIKFLPDYLHSYVDFYLSPRAEVCFDIFRGVCYQEKPDKDFDFIFIDGPELIAPSDGCLTFDSDYLQVVEKSLKPVFGIVDHRLTTVFVLQNIFGLNKVYFNYIKDLGYVGPCTKNDIKHLDLESLSSVLDKNARLFGNTSIKLV